ncbi:hypothetical protein, partial [Nodularia spumigena]
MTCIIQIYFNLAIACASCVRPTYNDVFEGRSGNDTFYGGDGNDTFY